MVLVLNDILDNVQQYEGQLFC